MAEGMFMWPANVLKCSISLYVLGHSWINITYWLINIHCVSEKSSHL